MRGQSLPVLVIGSLNIDLVAGVEKLPLKGETIFGKTFSRFPGGKGANQAIAAARLGASVTMVGCVGDDDFGCKLRSGLAENHVDSSMVRVVNNSTGMALITVDSAGANTIVVVAGANDSVETSDIDKALDGFISPGVLLIQNEIPAMIVHYAVKTAKRRGWFVILNPAPVRVIPNEVMQHVDVLIPNETEAEVISKRPIKSQEDAADAAKIMLAMGAKAIVVTLGSQGALCCTNDGVQLIPALQVLAVDSTAAGDAFAGAMAYALSKGETLLAALQIATIVAGLAVTRVGAQPSLPWWDEVKPYLN